MQEKAIYKGVFPIGDTNPQDLPVPDLEQALPFYEAAMGFAVKSRSASPCKAAVVGRDDVEMRLAENGGDPEQASCYMSVSDVDAAFQELWERGANPSQIRKDEHGGKSYRVFFVRAPDGLCYCLGQQV
jgi:predicted enzyme related to lactoylglutathione lyase